MHAAFSRGSLFLWAESSESFDAGRSTLVAAAEELGAAPFKNRATREMIVWIPSTKNGPIASIPAAEPPPESAIHLAPWTVTSLPLDIGESFQLIAACSGKRLLRTGLIAGDDLSYWASALRFAAGLVMAGQYLPSLGHDAAGFRARWQPVISGADVARIHALAAAMPAVGRAADTEGVGSPPELPAETVLHQFLNAAVDALVREASPKRPQIFESLHDHWMHALTASDAALAGKPTELTAFASQIEQWQRPVQVSTKAPFRLCFRLEEPERDDGPWLVRYLLQASRDPSLLLPAAEAWNLKPQAAPALGKNAAVIREHLLSSLGQAAGIYPPIEASLRERAPEGCALDAMGAHEFLRETAAVLEQSGFGVMLPAWWTRKGSRTRLTARAHVKSPKMQASGELSMDALVSFNWKLALGDETLTAAELAALARLKSPLVKVRGQWVEVDSAEIKAALDFLKKKSAGTATLSEIVRMSLGIPSSSLPVDISGVTASGWVGDVLGQLDGTVPFEEFPPPPGLHATLRPYQQRGYSWLRFVKRWGLGSCLADDMGLGKTVQALALIQSARGENGQGPVLIVCPTSVVGNWQKEAARFAPDLSVLVHHGAGTAQRLCVPGGSIAACRRPFQLFAAAPGYRGIEQHSVDRGDPG